MDKFDVFIERLRMHMKESLAPPFVPAGNDWLLRSDDPFGSKDSRCARIAVAGITRV